MGIDLAFFSAPDDQQAATVEGYPGGPLGWPERDRDRRERRRTGRSHQIPAESGLALPLFEGFSVRGYDPIVTMGTLESILTGRPYEEIELDDRFGASPAETPAPEDRGVISITDTLRDALVEADDKKLREVVGPWSDTEELRQPGWESTPTDEHLHFLRELRGLAVNAQSNDFHIYCYFRT